MKLYLLKRKNTADSPFNFSSVLGLCDDGKSGYIKHIRAFFRKKDAKNFLKKNYYTEDTKDIFEIKTITL